MQVSVFFIFSDKRNASKMRDIFTQTCFGRKWVKEIGVCFTQKCFEQKRVKLRLCGFALPALRTRTDNRHQHHKIDRICRHLQIKIKKGVKTDRHQPAQRTRSQEKPQRILRWTHFTNPTKPHGNKNKKSAHQCQKPGPHLRTIIIIFVGKQMESWGPIIMGVFSFIFLPKSAQGGNG